MLLAELVGTSGGLSPSAPSVDSIGGVSGGADTTDISGYVDDAYNTGDGAHSGMMVLLVVLV